MKKIEHALLHDVDLTQLQHRMSERVGQRLGMVAERPSPGKPGVVIFEVMGTTTRVPIDPRDLLEVIREIQLAEQEQHTLRVEAERVQVDVLMRPPDLPDFNTKAYARLQAAQTDRERWAIVHEFFRLAAEEEAKVNQQTMDAWNAAREEHGITECLPGNNEGCCC